MQNPAALLVHDAIGYSGPRLILHHGHIRHSLLGRQNLRARALQPGDEGLAALVVLGRQQSEIRGEALAEPDVVPIFLGDGIAKPLVRDFVRYQAECGRAVDRPLAVEYRAGVFHAAIVAGRLHIREFLIWIRADVATVEFDGLARRRFEGADAGVAVLVVDPGLERHSRDGAEMARSELRHADVVEPCGDRHGLVPVCEAAAVAKVDLFFERPIRHHLILRRSGHDEFARRFVVRVVDRRQPLMREVGPVRAEEASLSVFVVRDFQPAGGSAMVADGELAEAAGRRREWQRDSPAGVLEGDRSALRGDGIHVHCVGEVECQARNTGLHHPHPHRGFARDLTAVVPQRDAENVMLDVDPGLARIVVGKCARAQGEQQKRPHRTMIRYLPAVGLTER